MNLKLEVWFIKKFERCILARRVVSPQVRSLTPAVACTVQYSTALVYTIEREREGECRYSYNCVKVSGHAGRKEGALERRTSASHPPPLQ